jgi:hypothetical protein
MLLGRFFITGSKAMTRKEEGKEKRGTTHAQERSTRQVTRSYHLFQNFW